MRVIGIGNDWRGDDAAGLAVARALAGRGIAGLEVIEHHGEGTMLMELMKGQAAVVVVDAVAGGGAPGSLHRFDAAAAPLPADLFALSSHAFGVAQAIEMARLLGTLPPRLAVVGITGADFRQGAPMSAAVAAAVAAAAGLVEDLAGGC